MLNVEMAVIERVQYDEFHLLQRGESAHQNESTLLQFQADVSVYDPPIVYACN